MLGLTDAQLAIVMQAAATLAPEKRSVFLQRTAALLRFCPRRPSDQDIAEGAALRHDLVGVAPEAGG